MSLYGRTDATANKEAIEALRTAVAGTETIVFVDGTEASLAENASRGITGPGWWSYRTFTDNAGNTRHKAEMLAFITNPDGTETQADDTVAADVTSTISISAQPTGQTTVSGAATFSVTASATVGTVTYQWQRKLSGGTRWTNVSGATSASLVLAGQTADNDGDQYRVKLNSTAGAEEVISDAAALTFDT